MFVWPERSRIYEWFSFSHWGLFLLPLATGPDWYVDALDLDDERIERL